MIEERVPAVGAAPWKALWGKWGREKEVTPERPVHPLICHLLDVAAVAHVLWAEAFPPGARRTIARDLGVPESSAGAWLAFLAGSHDFGKAAPAFECQVPPLKEHLQRLGFSFPAPQGGERRIGHGVITAKTLPDMLEGMGLSKQAAMRLATVAGGHHGIFPTGREVRDLMDRSSGGDAWRQARSALLDVLQAQTTGAQSDVPPSPAVSLCLVLAGFITVADWIGSNTDFFPYAARLDSLGQDPADLADYHRRSLEAAQRAVRALGWAIPDAPEAAPFDQVFGFQPRPLQRAVAETAEALAGPGIVVVEAPMGEGKTEAALFLADTWARTAGTRGLYVALPTQATSNQMFTRVEDFLNGRYAGKRIEMQLLHGQAVLSAPFQELIKASTQPFTVSGVCDDDDPHGSVAASEWFTHGKRGLLAAFGVGTVDQALLAALKVKHGFVRTFGLACRTLIVDEVHAYDTYMSTLLNRLVEWMGAVHAPVVLLSATLPRARTEQLLACYARGAGWEVATPPLATYPRVTWLSESGSGSRSFRAATPNRRVALVRLPGFQPDSEDPAAFADLGRRLAEALADGVCAAVVCNTVARAQAIYQALQPFFPGTASDDNPVLDLFHARFPFDEREAREKRTLERFGKPSGPRVCRRPARAVLVATQVIEQSLDVDFDLLVTEMAPADLILQRSGRLHRHDGRVRPPRLAAPAVWLLEPEVEDGAPKFRRGSEAVYAPHVLLRSWLALHERREIDVQGDIETIVEATYGDAPAVPAALVARWLATADEAEKNRDGDTHQAEVRELEGPHHTGPLSDLTRDTREEDAPEIHVAHQAVTRLGPPSVQVVLLTSDAPELRDRSPNLEAARAFLRRSLDVSHRGLVPQLLAQQPPTAWQGSALLRHSRAVRLDAERRAQIGAWWLRLDKHLGVVVEPVEKTGPGAEGEKDGA